MSAWTVAVVAAACVGPVELRGGLLVDAPVERVSVEGVEVGGDERRTIGWDNVKRVIGPGADDAAPFMGMAERAWRARIRLARGDFGLASGLLEDLFAQLHDEQGPTALMVAEGTMACRLWFGDRVGAVEAWLEAARLRAAGYRIAGDPPLNPVLDPETLLTPALAPVWLPSDDLLGLAALWDGSDPDTGDVATRLRVLYAASARRTLGLPVDDELVAAAALSGASHEGVALVGQMVEAMSGDPDRREGARAALRAGLDDDTGTWREAWRRAALGQSLLIEEHDALRLSGMFELVHLPARFSRSQRYLAGVALARMSAELLRRGDEPSATRLRNELAASHPGTNALRWLDARSRALRTDETNQPPAEPAANERDDQ